METTEQEDEKPWPGDRGIPGPAGHPVLPVSWKPSPTAAEKTLTAALELFDDLGYSATTIEMIRSRADVSIGSIYHRFGSKEGIAGALYLRSLLDFQRGLSVVLHDHRDAETAVRAGVGQYLRWVDFDHPRARFLMRRRETEVTRVNSHDVDAVNRKTFGEMEEWHRAHVDAGAIRDLSLPLLYAVWFGPAQEYARQALDGALRLTRSSSSGRSPDGRHSQLLDAEPALADAAWAALRP